MDIYLEVESLDHKAVLYLIFWRNSTLFSTEAAPVCIQNNSAWGFFFFIPWPKLDLYWFIDDSHSDRYEMIFHCGFNLYFSDISDVEHLFIYLLATRMSSLERDLFCYLFFNNVPLGFWNVFLFQFNCFFTLYVLELCY